MAPLCHFAPVQGQLAGLLAEVAPRAQINVKLQDVAKAATLQPLRADGGVRGAWADVEDDEEPEAEAASISPRRRRGTGRKRDVVGADSRGVHAPDPASSAASSDTDISQASTGTGSQSTSSSSPTKNSTCHAAKRATATGVPPKMLQRKCNVVTLDDIGLDSLTLGVTSPGTRGNASAPTCTPTSSAVGGITGSCPVQGRRCATPAAAQLSPVARDVSLRTGLVHRSPTGRDASQRDASQRDAPQRVPQVLRSPEGCGASQRIPPSALDAQMCAAAAAASMCAIAAVPPASPLGGVASGQTCPVPESANPKSKLLANVSPTSKAVTSPKSKSVLASSSPSAAAASGRHAVSPDGGDASQRRPPRAPTDASALTPADSSAVAAGGTTLVFTPSPTKPPTPCARSGGDASQRSPDGSRAVVGAEPTPEALTSWLCGGGAGAPRGAELAEQLRAAAPQAYED